ncbi:hypothetical protein [Prevotella histicola]|jgi:hypothetical protein|uniref:Uncharacterized protein n=2 Tax=Prevotella histicola TaxID=470565 RepID=G6AF30_9BACT|nr:hypothetical protein [Prevotella histicola]EHG16671.1 hypothetical protein HMPREF9138_00798 [Prevotella histicola F0411]KGF27858.1 hypothetical protein HMPREF2132_05695 [Prevotella histicola JCM 15637 = DNF00424]MBF1407542.1 hypothetical protein [Prevotella histicola]MBF1410682.1 hypothetical protein [Prevotella histicola]MBF1422436.1 hypothetical protein [Prevotella histicola]
MENQNSTVRRPDHRMHRQERKDRFLYIRQWLNIIFMLGAVIGVIVYFLADLTTTGTIIILVAMVFKIIECILRFIR